MRACILIAALLFFGCSHEHIIEPAAEAEFVNPLAGRSFWRTAADERRTIIFGDDGEYFIRGGLSVRGAYDVYLSAGQYRLRGTVTEAERDGNVLDVLSTFDVPLLLGRGVIQIDRDTWTEIVE
jgi:hypothetical protein